ncbi:MAG: PQQ-binding-like beta-propeller repeat protein [Proteobacteria bacterium]|nr:PQQ-binding-like beta-propeller repeat protein [Pseudomonadota bacterium]
MSTLTRAYASLLFIAGSALLIGGALLLFLHGTCYYLVLGSSLVASAVLLPRYRRVSVLIYGAQILITLVWAIWEAGNDAWVLAARIMPVVALGGGLVRSLPLAKTAFLLLAAIACGAVAHGLWNPDAPDPLYRAGIAAVHASRDAPPVTSSGDWVHVGNGEGATRFSDLTQITPDNVSRLEVAWVYHTGQPGTALEVTPLKIGGLVYLCTGTNDVIALDAETGLQRWRFSSGAERSAAIAKECRGVTYFHADGAGGSCADRIFTGTIDARLIALDASTGAPCAGFGIAGQVSLLAGMGDWRGRAIPGYYYVTSAPTVVRGNVIVGGWVSDAQYWGEPSGVVRAYNALTGKLEWAFDVGHPDRRGEPPPGEQYTPSTPNAWAPMSADEKLGLVYVPTGNTSGSDYYGVLRRPFDDQFSSSVVALDAAVGSVRWQFQTVHHDLWDYDVAPQPVLAEVNARPALIQATKTGEIFVLDRASGAPIRPVQEVPVSTDGHVPGERIFPTQPASVGMPSFAGPRLEERDMWGVTPIDEMLCRISFQRARYDGIYTPPGVTPFIQYPGILGGIEWSSVALDPVRRILVVNSSRIANYARLIPRAQADAEHRKPEGFGGHYPQRTQAGTPYAVANPPFLSILGIPCQKPPYGTLSAVDVDSGRLIWTRRLGSASGSGPRGTASHLPLPLGTPNLGGSLATRAGLVFIAAGQDRRMRAFRTDDGMLVWQHTLPAASVATPMTYRSDSSGRQFIVVAAGNADPRMGAVGDAVVAYALPHQLPVGDSNR